MTSQYPPHRAHTRIMKLTAAGAAHPCKLTTLDWLLSIAHAKGLVVAHEDGLFHLAGFSARTSGQLLMTLRERDAVHP